MKKNYLKKWVALLLAICVMAVGLPFNASAAITGNSYAAIISSLWETVSDSYTKNALLYDLDGNGTEELVLLFANYFPSGACRFCYSVYTYEKGSAKPVVTAVEFDSNASKANGWLGVCRVSGKTYFTVYSQNGIQEADGAGYYGEHWKMYSFHGAKLTEAISVDGRSVTRNGVKHNNHSEKNGKAITLKEYESWKSSVSVIGRIRYYDKATYSYLLEQARMADMENKALTGTNPQFTDVPSWEYYTDAVNWAVKNGITSGTSATTFSPDQACTRGQAVTFLWNAAGKPEPDNTIGTFSDVAAGSYYEKAVRWAVENDITSGTGNGRFSPESKCTRGQIVTFLYRMAGNPSYGNDSFHAVDCKESDYFYPAVNWSMLHGITSGTKVISVTEELLGTFHVIEFSPNQPCTRGQIVTFLYHARK